MQSLGLVTALDSLIGDDEGSSTDNNIELLGYRIEAGAENPDFSTNYFYSSANGQ